MSVRVLVGDCREVMRTLDAESIDAIVTDPPYGLSFMGKGWDHGVPGVPFWSEACRVLKPGAHMVAFGGTRTFHRLAVAIEDAGFEIRDCLMWLYGSGFPKSLDVSKAIDKAAGAEREVIGYDLHAAKQQTGQRGTAALNDRIANDGRITAPATDAAKQWQGFGTALKPAWEPIILARKPLTGTVAANVLQHGTGALNIDGCRIETDENLNGGGYSTGDATGMWRDGAGGGLRRLPGQYQQPSGRWPANVVLDEDAAALLDTQSGERKAGGKVTGNQISRTGESGIYGRYDAKENSPYGDTGGASRFFYTAKASRAERNKGLDGLPEKALNWSSGEQSPGTFQAEGTNRNARNHHPTVKPLALMQWLCRLITPPGGVVLDPFGGSGSTMVAADREGFDGIYIDLSEEYAEITRRRFVGDAPLFARVEE